MGNPQLEKDICLLDGLITPTRLSSHSLQSTLHDSQILVSAPNGFCANLKRWM